MNYFDSTPAAERYHVGRPDFHANTIRQICDFLEITSKLDNVLDIACGTGLSTKALLPIAKHVYGTDISAEMLAMAPEREHIQYAVAPAEQQPFGHETFDLVTVSSAVHWFDIDAFLAETNRILKPGAWLVVYENYFPGKMVEDRGFSDWVKNVYIKNFPSPPRNKNYDWSEKNLGSKNFLMREPADFENIVSFTRKLLINYLTTQSNVIAVVDRGEKTYAEVEEWLNGQLQPYFADEEIPQSFIFANRIKYLQKIGPDLINKVVKS